MDKQFLLSKGEALLKGVGTGMFQTVSFCSWALIVWVGAIVVTAKRASGDEHFCSELCNDLSNIHFIFLTQKKQEKSHCKFHHLCRSLTYAAPDMQVFNQAKAAGNQVFQVIHRKPSISSSSRAKTLEGVDGNIDIRDVYFAYPSRQEN